MVEKLKREEKRVLVIMKRYHLGGTQMQYTPLGIAIATAPHGEIEKQQITKNGREVERGEQEYFKNNKQLKVEKVKGENNKCEWSRS